MRKNRKLLKTMGRIILLFVVAFCGVIINNGDTYAESLSLTVSGLDAGNMLNF